MLNKRNKILILILGVLISLAFGQGSIQTQPEAKKIAEVETKQLDPRAKILANYFKKYNSPLENQAQDFIDAADRFGMDWKLVPAISGVESTFGKNSYGYNAWGWGIYGNNRLGFSSWKDGINTVSEGLRKNYLDKGLTNPYSMNRIYAASPTWGSRVTYFMNDMEKFAGNYQPKAQSVYPLTKISHSSAQIALR